MKKVLLFSALALLSFAISCTKSPSVVGTWVQPATGFSPEIGFVLLKDGSADGINMGYVSYQSWKQIDNVLIISGERTGAVQGAFSDTLVIEKVTDEELVLSQSEYTVTYKKKK